MLQLYFIVGFLSTIPAAYGIARFRQLSLPFRIFVIGAAASQCLWLFSYVLSHFKLGSTSSLHYLTPILYSIQFGFFYKVALKKYAWSGFLPLLVLPVLGYILIDLYRFGSRKMAIDLMTQINAVVCVLGLLMLTDLLKQKIDLKRNGLFWLNTVIVVSAILGIVSNLLLSKLFEYQNNEWFSMLYFGFWSIVGSINIGIITYSIFLDSRKLPSLDEMPSFDR